MLLIYGRKEVRQRVGWVAIECPACRQWRAMQLERVGLASHIYYIPLSRGMLVGYAAKCSSCKGQWPADPEAFADAAARVPPLVSELVRQPWQPAEAGPGSPDERRRRLRSAFVGASILAEQRYRTSGRRLDPWSALPLGAMLTLVVLLFLVGAGVEERHQPLFDGVLGWSFLACIPWAIWALRTEKGRYFRRMLRPTLVAELQKLQPTLVELREAVAWAKKFRLRLAHFWQADALAAAWQGLAR